jgi:flavorubredoxin
MPAIVLYISYFGNTKILAEKLAEELNITEIYGSVFGRLRAFLHMIRILGGKYPTPNLTEYDTIYVGCPVWAGAPAPSLKKLLNNSDLTGKEMRFFTRAGSGNAERVPQALEALTTENGAILAKSVIINGSDSEDEIKMKFEELIA